jgi:DNA-binding XRE family transcriptional regulator
MTMQDNEISRLRKALGMTRDQLAAAIDITKRSLYNYEHGKTETPLYVIYAIKWYQHLIKGKQKGKENG